MAAVLSKPEKCACITCFACIF